MANWHRNFLAFGFVILASACSEDSENKLQIWPQCPEVFDAKTFRFYGDNPQEITETLSLQRYISTLTALSRDDSFGPREELGDMDIVLNVATKCYLNCIDSYIEYCLNQTSDQVICTEQISDHCTSYQRYFNHLFCMMD